MFPYQARAVRGYGAEFKRRVREMQSGFLMMGGYCKVTAHPDNRVTVDPNRKDAHGIPIPVVRFRFHEMDRGDLCLDARVGDRDGERLKC